MVELNASFKRASDFYHAVLEKLPGVADIPDQSSLSSTAFRQALIRFHQQKDRVSPNHRVLLLLDEYAYLIPDGKEQSGIQGFIEVLGILKSLHQEGWLLLLPCGRTAALSRQASWGTDENPFLDLLHARFLQPLPKEENDVLMTTLGIRAGITFNAGALRHIYTETGGHPSFSRDLGSQILKAARKGVKEVNVNRVEKAVNGMMADRESRNVLLAIYETRMNEEEQRISKILALEGPQSRKAFFPPNAKDDERRIIRDSLANLIDTTILVEQPDGKIAHRYGLLQKAIKRGLEELGY